MSAELEAALDWLVGVYTWWPPSFRTYVVDGGPEIKCAPESELCPLLQRHVELARQESRLVETHQRHLRDRELARRVKLAADEAYARVMEEGAE